MALPVVKNKAGGMVTIYTLDGGGEYPVHGSYLARVSDANVWIPAAWTADGYKFRESTPCDLDIPKWEIDKIREKDKPIPSVEEAAAQAYETLQV